MSKGCPERKSGQWLQQWAVRSGQEAITGVHVGTSMQWASVVVPCSEHLAQAVATTLVELGTVWKQAISM